MSVDVSENPKLLLDQDGSPRPRICGFETEYGYDILHAKHTSDTLKSSIARSIYSGSQSSGFFSEEGAREYVDVGNHPEYATPESLSFLDATYRMLRGHVITANRYQRALKDIQDKASSHQAARVLLIANTSSINNETWGNHESILTTSNLRPEDYIPALAALRSSRIVWSGAGVVRPGDKSGDYKYELSEKARFICCEADVGSTMNRPLVNLRDEALADASRYRRIHDISGETIFSPHANALRLATASIVLRACEIGVKFEDLVPEDPVRAIKHVSADPTLKSTFRLSNGKYVNGVEHQLLIAERAISVADAAEYLTDEEKEWSEKWLALCEDLAVDYTLGAKRVDWVVKQLVIEREMTKPRKANQTDYEVALGASLAYHKLLPNLGQGMIFLRRALFEDSPDESVLDAATPLGETRARLRVATQMKLLSRKIGHSVNWNHVTIEDGIDENTGLTARRLVKLSDPYATENTELDEFFSQAA